MQIGAVTDADPVHRGMPARLGHFESALVLHGTDGYRSSGIPVEVFYPFFSSGAPR
jgi:hypothetical protein